MRIEHEVPRAERLTIRLRSRERRLAEIAAAAAGTTVSELIRAGLRAATDEILEREAREADGQELMS